MILYFLCFITTSKNDSTSGHRNNNNDENVSKSMEMRNDFYPRNPRVRVNKNEGSGDWLIIIVHRANKYNLTINS